MLHLSLSLAYLFTFVQFLQFKGAIWAAGQTSCHTELALFSLPPRPLIGSTYVFWAITELYMLVSSLLTSVPHLLPLLISPLSTSLLRNLKKPNFLIHDWAVPF